MSGVQISSFRDRFNELIESSPKSRTVIAQEFGVAKQTISAWITGQSSPRLPVAAALAEYFDVDFEWLMGFDVPRRKPKPINVDLNLRMFNDDTDRPKTTEARLVSGGIDKMPPEKRVQALRIMQAAFPEYIKEE